jgi:hypothetical protein
MHSIESWPLKAKGLQMGSLTNFGHTLEPSNNFFSTNESFYLLNRNCLVHFKKELGVWPFNLPHQSNM